MVQRLGRIIALRRYISSKSPSSLAVAVQWKESAERLMDVKVDYDTVNASMLNLFNITIDVNAKSSHKLPEIGSVAMPGSHLTLFPQRILTKDLSDDGYEGAWTPPNPFIRRMWLSGKLTFSKENPILVGSKVQLKTSLASVDVKDSQKNGPIIFTNLNKVISNEDGPCLWEERSLVYLAPPSSSSSTLTDDVPRKKEFKQKEKEKKEEVKPDFEESFSLSSIDIFRFSAITFNSHKIHYNQGYAREEGYPDILVQGPFTACLLLDVMRRNLAPNTLISSFEYKLKSPAFAFSKLLIRGTFQPSNQSFQQSFRPSCYMEGESFCPISLSLSCLSFKKIIKNTARLFGRGLPLLPVHRLFPLNNNNKMKFVLESNETLSLPTRETSIKVFNLENSNFRLVFVDLPGPLVSSSIVIPTTCRDHKGLPHTLEHLIFCGSISTPNRGFLDNLAVRCCSTGTNAYTTEDHTCYELTTAGSQGMLDCFPVFLDHVLNPTLLESQFMTEVHHIDGDAKHQGVVFCEMAARENTEEDLLDLSLREMVYNNQTTYAYECGGLTPDVAKLTNEEIKEYHKQFYHLDNCSAIICGQMDPQLLFDKLALYPHLFSQERTSVDKSLINVHQPNNKDVTCLSRTVSFPSEDDDVGSIGYAWQGPASEDVKAIIALEVLFRYFDDNPSSPLPQTFIELSNPLASDIDLDIKAYIDSPIMWIFSGIPLDGEEGGDISSEESESGSEESGSDSGSSESGDDGEEDLFGPGVFRTKVMNCVTSFIEKGFPAGESMSASLKRHRLKIQESLEDSPHEMVAMNLIPDLLRFFLASKSSLSDTLNQNGKPVIGLRMKAFEILDELEKEGPKYWQELANSFLGPKNPMFEILMVPDQKLGKQLIDKQRAEEKERVKLLGKAKLEEIRLNLLKVLDENKVDLTPEVLKLMPPIPDVSKAAKIEYHMENVLLQDSAQFSLAQIVKTETSFVHLGLAFNISSLPKQLKPYLVIFQELLFQSPLELTSSNGKRVVMGYQEVSRYSSKIFVSHECGVGFGNSVFGASYISQIVTLFATATPADFEQMMTFCSQVVLFSVFNKERIVSIAKNLSSDLTDSKRDGQSLLDAVLTRIAFSSNVSNEIGANDHEISIFQQEAFLKKIVDQCKNGKDSLVIEKLNELRSFIVNGHSGDSSFFRLGVPLTFKKESSSKDMAHDIIRIWKGELEKFSSLPSSDGEMKKGPVFPFPRIPFAIDQIEKQFSNSVLVPVSNITSSYMSQFVACDLLKSPKHPDYFPTVLLSEILSKSEGPLYAGIRGRGYAYGANLSCYMWSGQLAFDLYKSGEPQKALVVFYEIIESLFTESGFASICSPYEIETAQASLAYRWASGGATAGSLIANCLRTSLQGFKSFDEHMQFIEELYKVTPADLQRVLKSYLAQFLDPKARVTILITNDGKKALETSFSDASLPEAFRVKMKTTKLNGFSKK